MRVIKSRAWAGCAAAIALFALLSPSPNAQGPSTLTGYDFILDTYVRDGYVYYRALKADRRRLDAYVGQLAAVDAEKLPKDEQIAFWLNTYNALVLQTVVDHYPAPRRSTEYPAGS